MMLRLWIFFLLLIFLSSQAQAGLPRDILSMMMEPYVKAWYDTLSGKVTKVAPYKNSGVRQYPIVNKDVMMADAALEKVVQRAMLLGLVGAPCLQKIQHEIETSGETLGDYAFSPEKIGGLQTTCYCDHKDSLEALFKEAEGWLSEHPEAYDRIIAFTYFGQKIEVDVEKARQAEGEIRSLLTSCGLGL